jgi:hypothetical protein
LDLLGFAISTAQQIVAAVIAQGASDWWSRRHSRQALGSMASDVIKLEVIEKQDLSLSARDFDELVRRILAEVRRLADDHPDLEWRGAALRPLRPLPPVPSLEPTTEYRDRLVAQRLERLNSVVAMRRLQVGLPATLGAHWANATAPPFPLSLPAPSAADQVDHFVADEVTIEAVPLPRDEEDWEDRLRQAQRAVQQHRARRQSMRNDGRD